MVTSVDGAATDEDDAVATEEAAVWVSWPILMLLMGPFVTAAPPPKSGTAVSPF